MQSNTARLENQCVQITNFPKKTAKLEPEPFTVVNGHYVGSDGFVVPRDFDEFSSRFPNYVRKWVRKHSGGGVRPEDVDDWTQDLTIHLLALSPRSRYRDNGKQDLVQTFDPQRHYGANQSRFWNYINLCLTNKFRTMRTARMTEPICRPGNVSLCGRSDAEEHGGVDDEFCHLHSIRFRTASESLLKQTQDRCFIGEFTEFISTNDGEAREGIEAILGSGSRADAAEFLGITNAQFGRIRNRLRLLGRCFEAGSAVPEQRKPYRRRRTENWTIIRALDRNLLDEPKQSRP
jgi:hypothetical protein